MFSRVVRQRSNAPGEQQPSRDSGDSNKYQVTQMSSGASHGSAGVQAANSREQLVVAMSPRNRGSTATAASAFVRPSSVAITSTWSPRAASAASAANHAASAVSSVVTLHRAQPSVVPSQLVATDVETGQTQTLELPSSASTEAFDPPPLASPHSAWSKEEPSSLLLSKASHASDASALNSLATHTSNVSLSLMSTPGLRYTFSARSPLPEFRAPQPSLQSLQSQQSQASLPSVD